LKGGKRKMDWLIQPFWIGLPVWLWLVGFLSVILTVLGFVSDIYRSCKEEKQRLLDEARRNAVIKYTLDR